MKLKVVQTARSLGLDNTFSVLEELISMKNYLFGTKLVL